MKTIRRFFIGLCFLCTLNGFAQTATTDPGVIINDIKWATRNLNTSGTFTANPEDAGGLYLRGSRACPSGWRVPTREELESLMRAGSTWVTRNGVNGRLFGTAPDTLFLPVAGYIDNYESLTSTWTIYWSSTEVENIYGGYSRAYSLDFGIFNNSDVVSQPRVTESMTSYKGSVRCVSNEHISVKSISLDSTYLQLPIGEERSLIATVLPNNATDRAIIWTSSNTDVATVDSTGKVTAISAGSMLISAKVGTKTSFCNVYVPESNINYGLFDDQGVEINGVVWATRNVDKPGTFTTKSEDFGMLYQWNRPVGWSTTNPIVNSDGGTTWDSYGSPNTNWETINNVCPGGWRLPTSKEMESLFGAGGLGATINGVNGRFLGTDSNTIFLPEAGYRDNNSGGLRDSNIRGQYWVTGSSYSAHFYGTDNTLGWSLTMRNYGHSVRCVADSNFVRVSNISLDSTIIHLSKGEEKRLTAEVFPENATNKTVTWSSSNKAIATVDTNGNVTAIASGKTIITVQAGTKIITCEVVVLPSTNANLAYIRGGGNVDFEIFPPFNPNITVYTAIIPYYIGGNNVVCIFGTPEDKNAISMSPCKYDLQVGENLFSIIVTAEDLITQKTYMVRVMRDVPSSNANLQSLYVSNAEITPAFNTNITNYKITVPFSRSYIDGNGYTVDDRAIVNNNISSFKFSKYLNIGENIVDIVVTAEDGITKKTYTLIVTREALPERAETIRLTEPGTLNSALFTDFLERPVTKLTLTGNIDARDIYFLDSLQYLTALDLENANIVAYEGVAGYNKEKFYPANELPDYSFSYMQYLTSIILPKTLTSIGNGVLNGRSAAGSLGAGSIVSIHIPEGVTKIGYGCFIGQSFTTVSLPSTLTQIGGDSFLYLDNLSAVINHNPNPIDIQCVFTCGSFRVNKPTLYVPYGSGDLYREANGWKEFNVVELPNILDNNISITPSEDNALIAWEPLENAAGYLLKIYEDEEHTKLIRTLEFDANGQFVKLRAGSVTPDFSFMLENLSSGTTYYYTLETLAANNVVLLSQSGEFTTTGGTVDVVETQCIAFLPRITGYYSILGVKLPKEPASGMYIIKYDDGTAKKIVKTK